MLKITVFIVLFAFGLFFTGCEVSPDATFRVSYIKYGDYYGYPPTDPEKYKYGEVAIAKYQGAIYKEGYTFKNWNTSPHGDSTPYKVGEEIIVNKDIFLYVIWTPDN